MAEPIGVDALSAITRNLILPHVQEQMKPTLILNLLPAPSAEAIEAMRLRHAQQERELVARVRAMTDDELLDFISELRNEGY